jgi:uncharacterized protein (TIGR03083 family)
VEKRFNRFRKRLQTDGEKTIAFFDALQSQDLGAQVYTTGSQWKVHQILAHLISAERMFHQFIHEVLNGGEGAPADFDIDRFNEADVPTLAKLTKDELVSLFQEARATSIALADNTPDEKLSLTGRHPLFGQITLGDALMLICRHNLSHKRDVLQAIESNQPVPHQDLKFTGSTG